MIDTPGVRRIAVTLLALGAVAGCGAPGENPTALLAQAKRTVDAAPTIHFVLTSSGLPPTGVVLTAGEGDARRPDGFAGSLQLRAAGSSITVGVVSVGGVFYARLPFQSFERASPSSFGFGDPGRLLSPEHGLSQLLVQTTSASDAGRDRYNGEELAEVRVTLPGHLVASLLTSADPSENVDGTVGVDPQTHQVRRVVLTGPFLAADQRSTFTLILDRYGENVSITPPP